MVRFQVVRNYSKPRVEVWEVIDREKDRAYPFPSFPSAWRFLGIIKGDERLAEKYIHRDPKTIVRSTERKSA